MSRPRAGFTLIELVVALGLGALALLAARGALVQLVGAAELATAAARRVDRDANADRLLRATVGQLEVGTAPGREFGGDQAAATFSTWCDTPGGWQERCTARVVIDTAAGGPPALTLALVPSVRRAAGPDPVLIRRDVAAGGLRYLTEPAAGGRWIAAWPPSVTAPLALGVVLAGDARPGAVADTLILRIGPRG